MDEQTNWALSIIERRAVVPRDPDERAELFRALDALREGSIHSQE